MNANRFFSVPYDNRNDVTIKLLRHNAGGLYGYGRWVALLGMLYDSHGCLRLELPGMVPLLMCELEFTEQDELLEYLETLADLNLIDATALHARKTVVSKGVCEQLEFRNAKTEAGKKGARAKKQAE